MASAVALTAGCGAIWPAAAPAAANDDIAAPGYICLGQYATIVPTNPEGDNKDVHGTAGDA